MSFEFSELTHKWCGICAGNIRKDASHCRFCHMHTGGQFRADNDAADAALLIDSVAVWLPDFNSLVLRCPVALQERFRIADLTYVQSFPESDRDQIAGKFSNRSSAYCGDFPPDPKQIGLLYDILLGLNECGENIERLTSTPKLVLLEITAADVLREAELRLAEQSANYQCKFCMEHIFLDSEQCRFCGSNGQVPPAVVSVFDREPDIDFLKSILIWEAARRQSESEPPLAANILECYEIDSTKIAFEVERQHANPIDLPLMKWRKRILELQLKTTRPMEDLEMYDLLNLGLACRSKDQEAEVIYNHGLRRVNSYANPAFAKQLMLDGLEQVYFSRKDYEAHHRIKEEVRQLRLANVPEHMRQTLIDSEKDTQAMLERVTGPGPVDPRQHLADREASLLRFKERQEKLIEKASSPEIRRQMEKQLSNLNRALGSGLVIAKTVQDAIEAKEASEFKKAKVLLEDALGKLGKDWMDLNKRITILTLLAEVQMSLGQEGLAESLHQQSIAVGGELRRFNDSIGLSAIKQSCLAYAKFLSTIKRYEESEKQLMKSLECARSLEDSFQKEFKNAKTRPIVASVLEELAKLLRLTDRLPQAEEMERQVEEMKIQTEKRENEIANDRRNYHEMVTPTLSPPTPPSPPETDE